MLSLSVSILIFYKWSFLIFTTPTSSIGVQKEIISMIWSSKLSSGEQLSLYFWMPYIAAEIQWQQMTSIPGLKLKQAEKHMLHCNLRKYVIQSIRSVNKIHIYLLQAAMLSPVNWF